MTGQTVSRVEASLHPDYRPGDLVLAMAGWQEFAVSDGRDLMRLPAGLARPSWALGILGMTGFTAYMGLLDIGKPRPGETVVVAAATGAVGSAVGQIAKLQGCRVVGIAGGAEKCRWAVDELRFDACIDHRSPALGDLLAAACPGGIDVYFENVGGKIFRADVPLLNPHARVPVCGLIAHYDAKATPADTGLGTGVDARHARQTNDHARIHHFRRLRPPIRRVPCFDAGLAARRPHQVPRGHRPRLGKCATGLSRIIGRPQFRQTRGPPRRCTGSPRLKGGASAQIKPRCSALRK